MANLSLTMFDDNDYKEDTPTVGLKVSSGSHVLNYTLDFTDEPLWEDIDATNIEMMGRTYFILSHTANTTINLLDSGTSTTIQEGETKTVTVNGKSYDVSISFIGSDEVKLDVNGGTTNSLQETETQKLSDGAYVGIKDILYDSKTGSISSVEFSIGAGKLVLKHNTDVELNDDSISDLKTYITTDNQYGKIQKIALEWKADDDLFVTPDNEVEMPGFKAVKLSFAGMYYPSEETARVEGAGTTYMRLSNFPLKDSTETINLLYGDSKNFTGIGKEDGSLLRTPNFDSALNGGGTEYIIFNGDTDDYFVASYNDGTTAESYLMRATSFTEDSSAGENTTTIQYKKDNVWTDVEVAEYSSTTTSDSVSIGNVELTTREIDKDLKTVNISAGNSVNFRTLYSKEGMQVYLPVNITSIDTDDVSALETAYTGAFWYNASNGTGTTFNLIFVEEDRNGAVGAGSNTTLTLGWNAANTAEAYVSDIVDEDATFAEIGDTDVFRSFQYSELATEILWDKGADQYSADLIYHGDESYGEFYVNAPDTTVTSGSGPSGAEQLGEVLVKDSEVTSVSTKNLIIVGGSCINSAAATTLGVSTRTCSAAFTEATGVGSGEFLIQSVGDAYTTGKVALVVAGYEATDTVNAAKYLTTQTVDTMAGKKYKGTSSTSAELVTTEA
jgi:hypothetical protein